MDAISMSILFCVLLKVFYIFFDIHHFLPCNSMLDRLNSDNVFLQTSLFSVRFLEYQSSLKYHQKIFRNL